VVSVARRRLQESRAYVHAANRRGGRATRSARERLVDVVAVWRGRERGHVAAVGFIAFCQGLVSAGAIGWWTYYAEHERHVATSVAGACFGAAALVSVGGYVLCGRLMDRIGRRPTAALYVIAAVVCAVVTFQVSDVRVMLPFLLGTAFFGIGVAPVLSAFAAELFPTEVRAQASAWIRNGFGNTGSVLGPAFVGVVGATSGVLGSIGAAVSVLALVYLAVLPIVGWAIPETRDVSLDSGG